MTDQQEPREKLTPEQRLRLQSIEAQRHRHGRQLILFPPQEEHTLDDIVNEMNPTRHGDIRFRPR